MNPDLSLEPQRGPDYEARLLETRQRMDADRKREDDTNRATGEADREFWRRVQQERREAIASAESRVIERRDVFAALGANNTDEAIIALFKLIQELQAK